MCLPASMSAMLRRSALPDARRRRMRAGAVGVLWLGATALAGAAALAQPRPPGKRDAFLEEGGRVVGERTGALTTSDGLRLRLVANLGNVRILTQTSGQVSYKVRIETDSREPGAQELLKQYVLVARSNPSGVQLTGEVPWSSFRKRPSEGSGGQSPRFWVNFEVNVPRNYNVDVFTRAGNIETQDIDGHVSLITSGGNITAGRIGAAAPGGTGVRPAAAAGTLAARLETRGGHVTVQEVNGNLRATTAGGYISVTKVGGEAVLRSAGGHIRAGTIEGPAQLETGGGNITVQRAGANVTATTGGGQIDLGEAAGSIRAHTGGGGIRILRVSGETRLGTASGSIFLTQVQGAVRASTNAGSITAWFTPEGYAEAATTEKARKPFAASQLESGQGDIVVYLPRELRATVEATIEMAADHRIEADPSLPLKVSYQDSSAGGHIVRGECPINGGGEVLRLKTVSGNIRLKWSDTDPQVRLNREQMEQLRQRLEEKQQRLLDLQLGNVERLQEETARKMERAERHRQRNEHEGARWEGWARRLEEIWWGGVRVDPEEQQKKVVYSVRPVYPDVAKRAGIEGTVRLKIFVSKEGAVQDLKVLSGESLLANAAAEAVRQWRYQPTLMDEKPVSVVTTVSVVFKLR